MRVIAGAHRGRRLIGPSDDALRPTADRVKEALFSVLGERVHEARVLDLYAGTGALGIEALSRGATHVTFVEEDTAATRVLRMNLERCRYTDPQLIHICRCRAEHFLARSASSRGPYDIILADPPYAATAELLKALRLVPHDVFAEEAVVAIEHASKTTLSTAFGCFALRRRYEYGDTALSLYHLVKQSAVSS